MNIKINDTIIENVGITDSGDLIGLSFTTKMALSELDALFSPVTSPEIRIVDAEGKTTDMYKNRNVIDLHVSYGETENHVRAALLVTPVKIPEVEVLINQVNTQAEMIEEQKAMNAAQEEMIKGQIDTVAKQDTVIKEQEAKIATQETEIDNLKNALTEANAKIEQSEAALAETNAMNNTLMECVLEISEVVYA